MFLKLKTQEKAAEKARLGIFFAYSRLKIPKRENNFIKLGVTVIYLNGLICKFVRLIDNLKYTLSQLSYFNESGTTVVCRFTKKTLKYTCEY